MKIKNVKIFGERNTSTTAMKLLIEQNSMSAILASNAEELDPYFEMNWPQGKLAVFREVYQDFIFRQNKHPLFSWKHTKPVALWSDALKNHFIIFMIRHPASWVLGLQRKPYHVKIKVPTSLYDFVSCDWPTVERENLEKATFKPLELWNEKARAYLVMREKLNEKDISNEVISFESFAQDQIAVFHKIQKNLIEPCKKVKIISRSTKNASKDHNFYRDYYGNQLWKREIDEKTMALINDQVDWDVAQKFGYSPL